MKRLILNVSLFFLGLPFAFAQLPPGSTAPNWTMTDLNGTSHTLYDYLDQSKVVFLDFSATWCGPCWSYHNSGAFKDLYNQYGPPGSNNIMAFMIEGDDDTNTACLYGPSGCVGGTQGNWVANTPYPIIDNHTQNGPYSISYWPTIYGVCPNREITEVSQVGTSQLWDFAKDCSAPDLQLVNVSHVGCYGESDGSISISYSGGIAPFTFAWSNGATTENISNVPAGSYTVTVTGSLGGTKTLGPILVEQPMAPLELELLYVTSAGCGGVGGTAEVSVSGGTQGYDFLWNNGANTPYVANLAPGTYSCTVTDGNSCIESIANVVVDPPTIPTAAAQAPSGIDCVNSEIFLDGNGSTIGPNITYQWTTINGNIVSGANTLNDCKVNAGGDYQLLVFNNVTTCSETASVSVTANTAVPNSVAEAPQNLSCSVSITTLSGGGSSTGSNIEYLWTTVGGNIVSGATTLTPEVDEAGTYTIKVTDNSNGCSSEASTELEADTTPPNASAEGGELTCASSNVELQGNSTNSNVSYEWTGPGGFTSNEQNPTVSNPGNYTLVVTDDDNGCTESAMAEVDENTTQPEAEATGGTIDCVNAEVTLSGNSGTNGATFSWTGPNGFTSTAQNPEVAETGNYVLTVTGPNGCTRNATATVNANTNAPTADAGDEETLNCNASSVVLDGTGSSNGSQYSYSWTTTNGNIVSGENTLTPTVDEAGDYDLVVTNNNNGCTSEASTAVDQAPEVTAEVSAQTNINCFGSSTGSATAEATGGSGPFTYEWSNGTNTETAENLSAGTYTVVVTDSEACTATLSVTITQPDELTVIASATAQTEPGVNDGTASASAAGGTGDYTYEWNNGETTATIENLAPGTYTVIVTDDNGCTESQTVTVNEFGCAISSAVAGQDISCFGEEDGTASINLSNATAPYTYEWSNGETTEEITGLAPGTYTVTATDDNGCEVVASVEVEEPTALNPNTTATAVTSAGASNGTATANPTGGTGPYTYEWSNGETTATITGLPSANYTVTVTDDNGCTSVQTIPVPPFECTIATNLTFSNVNCNGENNGQATVTLTNGLSPYNYEWSNGETTATISNLEPGTYTVSVIDAVNCETETQVTIQEPDPLEVASTSVVNSDCGANNGSVTVEATGGTGNVSYAWSNGESGATVENLEPGSYTVSATDENECVSTLTVSVSVDDNIAPEVETQNISVTIGASGMVEITPEQVDNGSTDNCGIASISLDVSSFDCDAVGEQEVTLTVTDDAGNTSSKTAIVTVEDKISPQIIVQNITVSLDANGQATISPEMLDNGSADNCSIVEMSADITEFSCSDIGDNAVVLTVTDGTGNSSSGTAIVTVVDDMAPVVTCPENMVLPYCNPVGEYEVAATDNCAAEPTYEYPVDFPSGSEFPTGVTELEVLVTDDYDNSTKCQFTVTVPESMSPTTTSVDVSCFEAADGSATAEVTGGSPGYTYAWNTGATTATISDLGPGTYTVVVTDAMGCEETQSVTIAEPPVIATEVDEIQNENGNNQDGAISVTVTGGTEPYSYNWTDEDGNLISNEEDIDGLSAGNYTLEITDANGCVTTSVYTVQSVVSVIDRELAAKINLFPNPTTGLFTLSLEDVPAADAFIQVFSVSGKLVLDREQANIASGNYQLDLSGSAPGMYIVRMLIGSSVVTKRVMVSR